MTTVFPESLAMRFIQFAELECKGVSPLYERLSIGVAADRDLLALAGTAPTSQPTPNLLFAAVAYLLYADSSSDLARYYPNLIANALPIDGALPAFKAFAMAHKQALVALMQSRLVQTNEVRRCAYLYPALVHASGLFPGRPIGLVDIGTSAGLNLLVDRYSYDYGDGLIHGDGQLVLATSLSGDRRPPVDGSLAPLAARIGLDIHVVDSSDPDQALWLRSLIWPEHDERRATLEAAIAMASEVELDLREGDGFALAPTVAQQMPADILPCLFHTHVANQVDEVTLRRFLAAVDELGAARDLVHIFNNVHPDLHLTAYRRGERIDYPLARADGHVRFIEWLA